MATAPASIRAVVRGALFAGLVLSLVAAAPTAPEMAHPAASASDGQVTAHQGVAREIEAGATLRLVGEGGQIPAIEVAPAAGPDGQHGAMRVGLYRAGDGGVVDVVAGYSHTDDVLVEHRIDVTPDPDDTYIVHVTGSGTLTTTGASRVETVDIEVGQIGVSGWAVPWTGPRPMDGGYRLEMTPIATARDDAIGLVVYTAVRNQLVGVNHSTGHVCLHGRGATCQETRTAIDETSVYPVSDRVTVRSTAARLGPWSEDGDQFTGVIDIHRPGMQGVDEYSEVVLLPARINT